MIDETLVLATNLPVNDIVKTCNALIDVASGVAVRDFMNE
jgi:hypothetical protein